MIGSKSTQESVEKRTQNFILSISKYEIVSIKVRERNGQCIDISEAKELLKALDHITQDKKPPVIISLGDEVITDRTRKYLVENMQVGIVALIGTSYMARMMASLMMNFKTLPIPIGLFTHSDTAQTWIMETLAKKNTKKAS